MSLIVGTLIDTAKSLAYPWSEGPVVVNERQLVDYLGVLDRRIAAFISTAAPHLLAAEQSALTIAQATNAAGYPLTPTSVLIWFDFELQDPDTDLLTPIKVVNDKDLDHPVVHPAGIVRGGKFLPADPLEKRWEGVEVRTWFKDGDLVQYKAVAVPAKPTTRTSALSTPDIAETFLTLSLRNMLRTYQGATEAALGQDLREAQNAWLALREEIRHLAPVETESYGPVQTRRPDVRVVT